MKTIFIRLSLSLAIFFHAFSAEAFTLIQVSGDKSVKAWDSNELTFGVNASECSISEKEFLGAVDDAMNLWNLAPTSSVKLDRGADLKQTDPYDAFQGNIPEVTYIACSSEFQSDTEGRDPNFVAGTTRVFVGSDLMINRAALILNAQKGKSANIKNFSLEKIKVILAHELGHALGLGHTQDTESLMFYSASDKEVLSLSQDDIDGITYLYPAHEIGGDALFGCGSLSMLSPPSGPTQNSALLSFFLMLLLCSVFAFSLRRG